MSKVQKSTRVMERYASVDVAHSPAQRVDLRARAGAVAPTEFGRVVAQPAQPFMPAFYRLRDVLRITSLSRSTVYRRIAARRFPPPVHLGGRACGWSAAALQDWITDPEGYCVPAAEDSREPLKRGRPPKYRELKAP